MDDNAFIQSTLCLGPTYETYCNPGDYNKFTSNINTLNLRGLVGESILLIFRAGVVELMLIL